MSNPTFKASMISARLVESLKIRLGATALVEGVGTNGDPLITIGTGVSDGCNAIIRIVGEPTPTAKDIFGNASPNPNTPNILQLATENGDTGRTTAKTGVILADVFASGCYVEWYEETHATPPVEGTITASKLKVSIAQNLWNQLMGQ